MRSLPVVFREEAISDLSEIYRFIAEQSGYSELAWRSVERIQARCARIGDAPRGRRSRHDLASGLRTAPFEKVAVIAYLLEDDAVRVTNVFYGRRDFEALHRDHPIEE